MTHNNRNWQRRWRVDLEEQTATHEDGWIIRFEPVAAEEPAGDVEFVGRLIRQPADPALLRQSSAVINQVWRAWLRARERRH